MKNITTRILVATIVALSSTLPVAVHAGNASHSTAKGNAEISTEGHEFGRQGDPMNVTRTIGVDMSDRMRFSPANIKVREG